MINKPKIYRLTSGSYEQVETLGDYYQMLEVEDGLVNFAKYYSSDIEGIPHHSKFELLKLARNFHTWSNSTEFQNSKQSFFYLFFRGDLDQDSSIDWRNSDTKSDPWRFRLQSILPNLEKYVGKKDYKLMLGYAKNFAYENNLPKLFATYIRNNQAYLEKQRLFTWIKNGNSVPIIKLISDYFVAINITRNYKQTNEIDAHFSRYILAIALAAELNTLEFFRNAFLIKNDVIDLEQ